MAMTKKDFAIRLLFWLLPWPISRALPRSLRIYYFGPGAGPPPGFYDYWGTPGEYWPDMYTPPSPDQFPDIPNGPDNPYNPYTPGGIDPFHYPEPGKGDVFFGPEYWTPLDANTTWVLGHWHCVFPGVGPNTNIGVNGAWFVNYRPSYFHIVWTGADPQDINVALTDDNVMGNQIAWKNNIEREEYLSITFLADDISYIHIEQTDPGLNPININLIEFL